MWPNRGYPRAVFEPFPWPPHDVYLGKFEPDTSCEALGRLPLDHLSDGLCEIIKHILFSER